MAGLLAAVVAFMVTGALGQDRPERPVRGDIELCDVVNSTGQPRLIRAVGRVDGDGLLLVDMTCPVFEAANHLLGTIVRVPKLDVPPGYSGTFAGIRDSFERPLLQIVVQGRLHCKLNMVVEWADPLTARGDGFGEAGLIRCILEGAHLIRLAHLRPNINSPPDLR